MKIAISGSHGLLGSALIPFLQKAGHQLIRLVRKPGNGIFWNPESGEIDQDALEGLDALIHLAAVNIGSGLWTKKKKEKIYSSRVNGTGLLASTVARLQRPPKVFISASAVGYYGDRENEELTETSTPGNSFLARVCQAWEKATEPASKIGIRVVYLRFGLIFSPHGGIFPRLLLPAKIGAAFHFGSGKQYQPWVVIDDVVAVIYHVIKTAELTGPVNVVAPHSVTNREFTEMLTRVVRRPLVFSLPAPFLKLLPGNMAQELLLSSARVVPQKLNQSDFEFKYPHLDTAIRFLLQRQKRSM